jgi:hypothetical protein
MKLSNDFQSGVCVAAVPAAAPEPFNGIGEGAPFFTMEDRP